MAWYNTWLLTKLTPKGVVFSLFYAVEKLFLDPSCTWTARKEKEKTTPFGVNLMRSQILSRAAQTWIAIQSMSGHVRFASASSHG